MATAILPPTLMSSAEGERADAYSVEETATWKRISLSGVSTLCAAGVVALKVTNYMNWNANPIGQVLLSLTGFAALQNAVQCGLSRKWSNQEKSFVADYSALGYFLPLSQVYNNLTKPSSIEKQLFFQALTGIGGMCTVALIHTLCVRRADEVREMAPLQAESAENPVATPLFLLNSTTRRVAWNVAKIALGGAGVLVSVYVPPASLFRGYAITWIGDGACQLGHELWVSRLKPLNELVVNEADGKGIAEKKVDFYVKFLNISRVIARVAPGILLAAGSGVEKAKWSYAWAATSYAFAGAFAGLEKNADMIRFNDLSLQDKGELARPKPILNTAEKLFKASKWIYAIGGVGGFLGLGLAGFSFQTLKLEEINLYDRFSLGALAVGIYGTYALARVAKRYFDPRSNPSVWWNTFYFNLFYSPGPPVFGIYMVGAERMGDLFLKGYGPLKGVSAILGYLSLGVGLGIEAVRRGEYPHPREFSPIAAGLIFNFIFNEFTRQV